jgi:hypothetical protein
MVTSRIDELLAEADEFEATGQYALARLKRGDAEFYRRNVDLGEKILARLNVWKTNGKDSDNCPQQHISE